MKYISLILVFLLFFNGSIKVSWEPSESSDVAGYKIYIGNESGNYHIVIDAGQDTSRVIEFETEKPWYVTVTAYDAAGNESAYSNEVTINVKDLAFIDTVYYQDSRVIVCLEKIWYCGHTVWAFLDSLRIIDTVKVQDDTCFFFELPVLDNWEKLKIRSLTISSNQQHALLLGAETDVPMACDIDNDGRVNIDDLRAFDKAIGTYTGQEKYRLAFDLNRDGKITVLDMILFDKNYGRKKDD